jgi:hypothetical protein
MNKKPNIKFLIIILLLSGGITFSQFLPYYGKNKIHIGKKWFVYETDHFKINFYTENRKILNDASVYAEEAYKKLSEFLGYSINHKVPLLLYQSHKDFEMTNLYPYPVPEPVMGFSEPMGDRIVIPSEFSDHTLKHLITHELTHIFQFNLLYGDHRMSLNYLTPLPLWIMEGFAEYIPGDWDPISTMVVRDAVITNQIPKLNKFGNLVYGNGNSRSPYDFGHLVYDFLAKEYGKTGLRKFWWNLKRFALFRGRNIMKDTFNLEYPVFNSKFKRYLRKRYKKYFSKNIPDDYGLKISPEFPYSQLFSYDISPSREVAAIVTVNYRKYALTISLINLKTGKVFKDITPGYSSKFEHLYLKFNPEEGKSVIWDRKGEFIAFLGRYNYDYYLVFYSSLGKFLRRKKLKNLTDPTGLSISFDNKYILFSANKNAQRDIFIYYINKNEISQITDDNNYEYSPSFSKDGKSIVFSQKQGKYDQLYIMNLSDKKKIKITQNPTYHINPVFLDSNNILFSYYSEKAYNLATIDLKSKKIKILTDVSTGIFYPKEINNKLFYLGFSGGEFSLFSSNILKPIRETTETETYTIPEIKENLKEYKIRPYKKFEDIVVSGLPNIGFAVATDGTTYGGAYLNFSDTLNNNSVSILAYSVMGFKNYALSYLNLGNRLNYQIKLFTTTYFYYLPFQYWQAQYEGYYSYKDAIATRKTAGIYINGIYPLNKFHRISLFTGLIHQKENLYYFMYPQDKHNPFFNGYEIPLNFSLTGETTHFRNYGPYDGYTYNISFTKYLNLTGKMRNSHAMILDLRKYIPIGFDTLFAFRAYGAFSGGENPYIFFGGGNNEIRSTNYYSMVGNNFFHLNAEFRFPLVQIALTPLGLIGPIRGVFFADAGGAWFNDQKFEFIDKNDWRLKNGIGSIGYGVEFALGGYPMHIEWVYRTDFANFNDHEVRFWIGFDF